MYQNDEHIANDMGYTEYNNIRGYEGGQGNPDPIKKKKGSRKIVKAIAFTLGFLVVAGGSFGAVYAINNNSSTDNKNIVIEDDKANILDNTKESTEPTIISTNTVTGTTISDVSGVVSEVMPSIVSIKSVVTETGSYFGQTYSEDVDSAGSGIIMSQADGNLLIVTNNHVVANAKSVSVTFADQEEVEASVKGTDSSNDLAVITVDISKLKESTTKLIRIASLGNSDELKVGEMVVAIGNALGYGQSVTVGYLSAKDRKVQTDDYTMNLLQTDAAINPGNSGGALLNASGQVIGINSVKYASTEVEGIGYAIPITYAVPIINNLINNSDIPDNEKGYLGVRFSDIDSTYLERYNMPAGIYINEVVSQSPASKGGLQIGDILTKIDGRNIASPTAFQEYLSMKRGGTEVTITYQRIGNNGYEEHETKITLGKRGDYSSSTDNSSKDESNGNPFNPKSNRQ